MSREKIVSIVVIFLGTAWFLIAMSKAMDLASGVAANSESVFGQLPIVVQYFTVGFEFAISVLCVSRYSAFGHGAAMIFLALATAALLMRPDNPTQSCGCLGTALADSWFEKIDPFARNSLLASVHMFVLVHRKFAVESALKSMETNNIADVPNRAIEL